MKAWVVDAADFIERDLDLNLEKGDLIINNQIKSFLKDNTNINFIIAPKGFGKTILLMYKRLSYQFNKKTGFRFIPSGGRLVDVPQCGANINWSEKNIEYFKDSRAWRNLWYLCLSLSIIQAIKISNINEPKAPLEDYDKLNTIRRDKTGEQYPLLRRLIYVDNCKTPLCYLDNILSKYTMTEIRNLFEEMRGLTEVISEIRFPIAIFIDNVDKYFEEHPEKEKMDHNPSARGEFDIDIWYKSQEGLMYAVKDICQSNKYLDIFVSIRKEAYDKIEGTMAENLRGQCLDLHYSYENLRQMFIKNIKWTDRNNLINRDVLTNQPFLSFFGYDEITSRAGNKDDVFSYIYRHTLKKPRDIIRMGKELAEMENNDRKNQKEVRDKVNTVANLILEDYIKVFIPHTCFCDKTEFKSFISMIGHNILTYDDLLEICCRFNNKTLRGDCSKCGKNVFNDLYKLGLLGTVEYDSSEEIYKQRFLCPGEKTFDDGILPVPDSTSSIKNYYLIHPILYNILGGSKLTHVNKSIVIGDGKDWTDPEIPDWKSDMSLRRQKNAALETRRAATNGNGHTLQASDELVWLHMSDIHFDYRNYETDLLRERLLKYLDYINVKFDFIVVTGDLTYKHHPYTEETRILLENIYHMFVKPGGHIFIVPGNHDLDASDPIRLHSIEAIFSQHKDPSKYFCDNLDVREYNYLVNSQTAFFNFYQSLFKQIAPPGKVYPVNDLHFVERCEDYNIVHLNTCLTCMGGKADDQRVIINQKKLRAALGAVDDMNVNIAIGHHSVEWLHPREHDQFLNTLSDKNIHIYLCGHSHDPKFGFYVNNVKNIYVIGSGSFTQDETSTAGIAIGTLNKSTGEGTVTYHKWSPKIEYWIKDNEVSREACDGVIRFKIPR